MKLSFDEWNVWKAPDVVYTPWQTGSPFDWVRFNMEDALVFGSAMLTLLKNADRIAIACQSLLVNTIPMILTDKGGNAWRNATFYPFLHVSRYGRGQVLRCVVDSPKYDTAVYSDVPIVDSVTVYNEANTELTVFAINRSAEPVMLELDIRDYQGFTFHEHIVMKQDDLSAVNTSENPMQVCPRGCADTVQDGGRASSMLDKYSWNVIRFLVKGGVANDGDKDDEPSAYSQSC